MDFELAPNEVIFTFGGNTIQRLGSIHDDRIVLKVGDFKAVVAR